MSEHRQFSVGIVDYNPRRMTQQQALDHGLPYELIPHLADFRQYPLHIGRHLPSGTHWFDIEQPWYFEDVMLDHKKKRPRLLSNRALILSGSGLSAYKFQEGQKDAFTLNQWRALEESQRVIRSHLGRGWWVLGICFGGQLAMHAVGGRIGRLPENRHGNTITEAGWLKHQLTEEGKRDPVFGSLNPEFMAPHLHNDYVAALPPEGFKFGTAQGEIAVKRAEVLAIRKGFKGGGSYARRDEYIHASMVEFDNDARLYQIQPHPEMAEPGFADFLVRRNSRALLDQME